MTIKERYNDLLDLKDAEKYNEAIEGLLDLLT